MAALDDSWSDEDGGHGLLVLAGAAGDHLDDLSEVPLDLVHRRRRVIVAWLEREQNDHTTGQARHLTPTGQLLRNGHVPPAPRIGRPDQRLLSQPRRGGRRRGRVQRGESNQATRERRWGRLCAQ